MATRKLIEEKHGNTDRKRNSKTAATVLEARDQMEEELKSRSRPRVGKKKADGAELAYLKDEFNRLTAECEELTLDIVRKGLLAVEKAYRAGEILFKVKEIVRQEGSFESWKKANLKCSKSTAANYMTVFHHIDMAYGDISSALEKHADGWSVREVLHERIEERRSSWGQQPKGDASGEGQKAREPVPQDTEEDIAHDNDAAELSAAAGVEPESDGADDDSTLPDAKTPTLDLAGLERIRRKFGVESPTLLLSAGRHRFHDFLDRFDELHAAARDALTPEEYFEFWSGVARRIDKLFPEDVSGIDMPESGPNSPAPDIAGRIQ
ncbi:MAG: hypothetical protein C4523_14240 [Myxococcales bacterium]|nr:MAG: hypothetical protein C4523_14240 [Myxococcales bacterium]